MGHVSAAVAVDSMASSMASPGVALPGPASIIYSVLHKVRSVWYYYRKKEIYANPNNFGSLAAGGVVTWLANSNVVFRVAAQGILIAHRVMAVVDQQIAVIDACKELSNAGAGHYPLYERCKWKKDSTSSLLSPSTAHWIKSTWRIVADWVSRVFFALITVLVEIFVLSMRALDAAEAFSLDPRAQLDGQIEIGVNLKETLKSLSTNGDRLLTTLKEQRPAMTKMFSTISLPITVDTLISTVENTLPRVKAVEGAVKAGDGVLGEMVKSAAIGTLSMVGLAHLTPDCLVPTPDTQVHKSAYPQVPRKCYKWPALLKPPVAEPPRLEGRVQLIAGAA